MLCGVFVRACVCMFVLFNSVVRFVFDALCGLVCCVCALRVFVYVFGKKCVCVCLSVMYDVMSSVLYCVCFVIGYFFLWCLVFVCVCVCHVLVWFRCDLCV